MPRYPAIDVIDVEEYHRQSGRELGEGAKANVANFVLAVLLHHSQQERLATLRALRETEERARAGADETRRTALEVALRSFGFQERMQILDFATARLGSSESLDMDLGSSTAMPSLPQSFGLVPTSSQPS